MGKRINEVGYYFYLDKDLKRKSLSKAMLEGKKLKDIINEYLEKYIRE